MTYLWIKVLHIISMVAWFAGLFYIFRLFVYHVQKKEFKDLRDTFSIMEEKLLRIIMLPAMTLTLATGILMIIITPDWLKQGWLHLKLLFVLLLLLYHAFSFHVYKRFRSQDFFLSEKACRLWNEVPTLILIVVVVLVVLKPF